MVGKKFLNLDKKNKDLLHTYGDDEWKKEKSAL